MKKPNAFASEEELCADFIAWAQEQGWVAYPETHGWDILLVEPKTGTQIGVQAKMAFNLKVLAQCCESYCHREDGPDIRAVLVPKFDDSAKDICRHMGFAYFAFLSADCYTKQNRFWPQYLNHDLNAAGDRLPQWAPDRRLELPAYVPDVAAGVKSPKTLSLWKVKALKIAALVELRGWVKRSDFKEHGISPTIWLHPSTGFLIALGDAKFGKGPKTPDFAAQHPTVWPQVVEDMRSELNKQEAA